jgi:Ni/Fe-hydrogenase subunit HybB-like protein
VPGWHTTIFPPYFVAGAIFSGFAMVLTLMIPARTCSTSSTSSPIATSRRCARSSWHRHDGRVAYSIEFFIAWYSGNLYEQLRLHEPHAFGPFWWAYFAMCQLQRGPAAALLVQEGADATRC